MGSYSKINKNTISDHQYIKYVRKIFVRQYLVFHLLIGFVFEFEVAPELVEAHCRYAPILHRLFHIPAIDVCIDIEHDEAKHQRSIESTNSIDGEELARTPRFFGLKIENKITEN